MNTYLCIITTVLVATQVIRVTQNAIQLHHQDIEIKKHIADLDRMNPTVDDFETQRTVMKLLKQYLEEQSDGSK